HEVRRGIDQLRRQRAQRARQQHAVLQCMGGVLMRERCREGKGVAMKRGSLWLVLAAAWGSPFCAYAEDAAVDIVKAEQTAVNLCSTCHGPRGVSRSAEFPILAAQREGYLLAQLDAFRTHA